MKPNDLIELLMTDIPSMLMAHVMCVGDEKRAAWREVMTSLEPDTCLVSSSMMLAALDRFETDDKVQERARVNSRLLDMLDKARRKAGLE